MKILLKVIKIILITFGTIFILMFTISLTSFPYWVRHWLGTSNSNFKFKPNCVIMLGAGKFPSESCLIRLYYTAEVFKSNDIDKLIITQPKDGNNLRMMKDFLIRYGVDSTKIYFEYEGRNTREQAIKVAIKFPEVKQANNILVTSPVHMRRSVFVFKKAGYNNIGGVSAFENSSTISLSYKTKKLGGKGYIPDVGNSISLRYDMWNYMIYEISSIREFFALAYYKLQGWT